MDPSLAPNFIPPSEQHPSQRVPRPLPHYMIPNFSPIQPYVLEDYHMSEMDAPLPRTPSISSISDAFAGAASGVASRDRSRRPSSSSHTPPLSLASHHAPSANFSTQLLEALHQKKVRGNVHFDAKENAATRRPVSALSALSGSSPSPGAVAAAGAEDDAALSQPGPPSVGSDAAGQARQSRQFLDPAISSSSYKSLPQPSSPAPMPVSAADAALAAPAAGPPPAATPSSSTDTPLSVQIPAREGAAADELTHKTSADSISSVPSVSPTPVPADIPRIPSELYRAATPPPMPSPALRDPRAAAAALPLPVDTPFPTLGPSHDAAPDKINTTSSTEDQSFVPQTPAAAELAQSDCTQSTQPRHAIPYSRKTSRSNSYYVDDRASIYDADDAGNTLKATPYTLEAATGGARPIVHSADLEEVPVGVTRQAHRLSEYKFPTHRLARVMQDETKSPLVIVACGSFSPITYLHLRMFEMAMDSIREQTRFEVIGGYYSPVSDNYKKQGLAAAHHRVRMCELACERTSSWLMVDAWESLQPTYQRTAVVLDHFNHEINIKRGGIATSSGKRKGVKIMLLAGGDLIESMGEPNVWAEDDLHHILGRYGCLIVERTGSDVRSFLLSHDIMYEHRRNVLVIKQLIYNDISSTKVRLFIRRGMSVQYLIPNSVIRYIQDHGLYIHETEPVKQVLSEKGD